MKIPVSFKLLGHTVEVKFGNTGKDNGWWEHDKKRITLNRNLARSIKSLRGETFCHEWAHCLLDHIGQSKLSQDEDLVESLGEALYQSLSTFKYGRRS